MDNILNSAYLYTKDNLPSVLVEVKEIRRASLKLKAMYLDEDENRYYEGQQKFLLDQNSIMEERIEKGIEKGIKKTVKKSKT